MHCSARGTSTQAEYEEAYLWINRYLQQFKPSAHPDAKEAIPLLKDFAGIWHKMNLAERRAILQTMFTGLYFDSEGQLRKASPQPI